MKFWANAKMWCVIIRHAQVNHMLTQNELCNRGTALADTIKAFQRVRDEANNASYLKRLGCADNNSDNADIKLI
jgi:hypothetical protein